MPAKRGASTVYVALLRGINVGGKNMVKMASLKESFERLGFTDVQTYINSGNVLFRSSATDPRRLERKIDAMLASDFGLDGKTVVRSRAEMERLVKTIKKTWRDDPEWRYNVVFLRHTIDSADIVQELGIKPELEALVYCPGALLWSARSEGFARSGLVRLPSRPIYREMTVRNLNTTTTVLKLMERIDGDTE